MIINTNVDLTTVSTGTPVLKPAQVTVRVAEMSVVQNKAQTGDLLKIRVLTEETYPDERGVPITPGHTIFDQISLAPTEKYPERKIHSRLAELQKCFLGGAKNPFDTDDFIGQVGTIALGVEDDDQYGRKNKVKEYKEKK